MKSFKKVLAVFLCAAMIVPGLCIGVYASDTCDCGNTPIVYMYGKQTIYLTREDGSKVNPLARDDLDIGGMDLVVTGLLLNGFNEIMHIVRNIHR